ncbi:pentapeptide repeat-containing protein [Streptomyces sp. XM4193]|uniref:pentapeptide repeat-containing protein n=1 Tax=Streptomyces sp. XM4193 TaxID=2929782 RepID=UPI001FFBDB76|nr:pentapeptide repeat-containing protein [Streptomyces sp. XM4193]MCK1795212.1 pentapeptide repeat-containing protein [Streptomyces sp. XM4193]
MTRNRPSQRAHSDQDLRLWSVGRALAVSFTVSVLVAGAIFFALVGLLGFQGIDSDKKLDAATLFDMVKLSFGVVAGAGALVALVVAYRRQRVDEAGAHREATRLHTERFTQAVEQLGSDSPAVRLGGVHALSGLSDDAPDPTQRQACIDVLCAYLRLPFTPDPGDDPAHQEEHHRYLAHRTVRHTILRLIGDHCRRPAEDRRSWQGHDLDLTGTTIDGALHFHDTEFSGGNVSLDDARFTDGDVILRGATFSGGNVSFDGAEFSGGNVPFHRARFSGGNVSFDAAEFSGGNVPFDRAEITGGNLFFDAAEFSGANVSFRDTTFADGFVFFDAATFTGGDVSFRDAAFSGGDVSFEQATGQAPAGLLASVAASSTSAAVRLPPAWTAAG